MRKNEKFIKEQENGKVVSISIYYNYLMEMQYEEYGIVDVVVEKLENNVKIGIWKEVHRRKPGKILTILKYSK